MADDVWAEGVSQLDLDIGSGPGTEEGTARVESGYLQPIWLAGLLQGSVESGNCFESCLTERVPLL
jgi:hypothetical protein